MSSTLLPNGNVIVPAEVSDRSYLLISHLALDIKQVCDRKIHLRAHCRYFNMFSPNRRCTLLEICTDGAPLTACQFPSSSRPYWTYALSFSGSANVIGFRMGCPNCAVFQIPPGLTGGPHLRD